MIPFTNHDHRPWAVPQSQPIMFQRWHDLLFMHWPVPINALQPLIPSNLTLDTFHGSAWIGIVPFRMSSIKLNWLPEFPPMSAFPELNVRTYVTDGHKAGVWFFSLDVTNPLAVMIARWWFYLPYFHARMSIKNIDQHFHYHSCRALGDKTHAEFEICYKPSGNSFVAKKGSLAHWLTERYCLYVKGGKHLYRGEIDHAPWSLQEASAQILKNTISQPSAILLPDTKPVLHFSKLQEVLIWPLEKLIQ